MNFRPARLGSFLGSNAIDSDRWIAGSISGHQQTGPQCGRPRKAISGRIDAQPRALYDVKNRRQ
jgi:hypothetical protein